jgi:hypothetical protein
MSSKLEYLPLDAEIETGESVIFAEFKIASGIFQEPSGLGGLEISPLEPTAIDVDGIVCVAVWLDASRWPTVAHYLSEIREARIGRVALRRYGGSEHVLMFHIDQLTIESEIWLVHSLAGFNEGERVPAFFARFPITQLRVVSRYAENIALMLRRGQKHLHPEQQLHITANICSPDFEI